MPAIDATVLKSILRQDFASFLRRTFHTLSPGQVYVPGWHIQAIAHRLQQVHTGEVTRLALNMLPRSLKSIAASVAFPAFLLGHDPTLSIGTGTGPLIGAQTGPPWQRLVPVIHRGDPRAAECGSRG